MKTPFPNPDGGKGRMLAVVFGILLIMISPMLVGCDPEVQVVVQDGLQSGLTILSAALIDAFFTSIQPDPTSVPI